MSVALRVSCLELFFLFSFARKLTFVRNYVFTFERAEQRAAWFRSFDTFYFFLRIVYFTLTQITHADDDNGAYGGARRRVTSLTRRTFKRSENFCSVDVQANELSITRKRASFSQRPIFESEVFAAKFSLSRKPLKRLQCRRRVTIRCVDLPLQW